MTIEERVHGLLCPSATPHERLFCSALAPSYEQEVLRRLAEAGLVVRPEPLEGTRLILVVPELIDSWVARTLDGKRITAEWGEQKPEGWYEPIFRVVDDGMVITTAELVDEGQGSGIAKAAYWFYRMVGNDGPDGSDLDEAVTQDLEAALRAALPRDEYPLWGEDEEGEF